MNSSIKLPNQTKVSIGMPVYNGAQFIKKSLDSLLLQTYKDFELIISDNASTDSTSTICQEYVKKDKRIRYIRQEKNRGAIWNFNFVLNQAMCEYFMWNASDDIRDPTYLEKNITLLTSDDDIVATTSKASFYTLDDDNSYNVTTLDSKFNNLLLRMRYSIKPADIYPLTGSYDEKVRKCLRKSRTWLVYGLFKTDILKKSIPEKEFVGYGLAIILNVLKFGRYSIVDEHLTKFYNKGLSKRGIISMAKQLNKSRFGMIFPYYSLTFWCAKNLGSRIFIKNIDYFIELNLWGLFSQVMDLLRRLIRSILKSK